MNKKFKFRTATKDDRDKVQQLFINSIVNEKNIFSPELVKPSFVEDFVNKVIDQGNMIIVENGSESVELIGEVHYYNTSVTPGEKYVKEMVFFSRMVNENECEETELVEWLYGEIEKKHSDVFSVGISTPVSNSSSVALFLQKGINIEGNYHGRLNNNGHRKVMLPLKWINPSFN